MGLEEVHGAGGMGGGGLGRGIGRRDVGVGGSRVGVREFRVSPNLIRAEKLT